MCQGYTCPTQTGKRALTPYFLNSGYTSRAEPEYFDDTLSDSELWQADVYKLAAQLGLKAHAQTLVDLGCGRAEKLMKYADMFQIVGVDFGQNIDYCQQHHHPGGWVRHDLNKHPYDARVLKDSVVICADVIEHLPDPMPLIQTLRYACQSAKYVLLSTPDRQRVHRGDHFGPPQNKYHVREWTNGELVQWLRSEDLPVQWYGWTISNQIRPDQVWTSLVVMSKTELVIGLPAEYEQAPIEWDSLGWKHD